MSKEEIIIKAQKRTVMGKKVNALRREGWLPGVVYGRHLQAFPIQMPAHETSLIMSKLTSSSLVTIDVDGEKHTAIVRDRQRDVIYGRLTHVDFLALSLNEKLRTTVGLELVGEAPVLKLADVILNQGVFELELECLPQDLPSKIEVDVSKIASMDDLITVGSLNLGDKITVLTDPSEVIISVGYSEQEKEPAAEAVEAPEVVERGKKEEEE
ncbi:MAG TPA: 50S ribosomal protein L25 [Anaerolineaceae bacterium]|jgi:large subunit ribosomal protein L25|nr:50S ribosomal protein L25 [Anaerolineaceae bacterium]HPT24527.1 50S ribosomal protein L25 [Anaerolineaceae bacterium]